MFLFLLHHHQKGDVDSKFKSTNKFPVKSKIFRSVVCWEHMKRQPGDESQVMSLQLHSYIVNVWLNKVKLEENVSQRCI